MVVVGERKSGIEINQPCNLLRVTAADRTQFFTGDGVSNQYRAIKLEFCDHGQHIVTQTVGGVISDSERWLTGGAEPAARDPICVIVSGKFRGEIIEYMGRVSQPCQENQRSPGTAPVEDFQLDTFFDGEKLNGMMRGVSRFLRTQGACR